MQVSTIGIIRGMCHHHFQTQALPEKLLLCRWQGVGTRRGGKAHLKSTAGIISPGRPARTAAQGRICRRGGQVQASTPVKVRVGLHRDWRGPRARERVRLRVMVQRVVSSHCPVRRTSCRMKLGAKMRRRNWMLNR